MSGLEGSYLYAMPERQVLQMTEKADNTKLRDSSSKIIFEDPILCAQFLRGYLDIPLLKDVQPEDIEDVTERYVHLFTGERNSDIVKRVRLKDTEAEYETPFYFISLIEHKSKVDYNVVMQIFRYMAFIWEDYEKETERKRPGISKTKDFKYPPILPVIFYDGKDNWTATVRFHERVLLSDVLGEYIPDYRCILMQLRDYSNQTLMEKKDELSIVLLVDKLKKVADFARIGKEVSGRYLQEITENSPEYLLGILSQIIKALLLKINVPFEEAEDFIDRIKERRMGELFADFEPYDVQATRRVAREEGRKEELANGIERLLKIGKKHGFTEEEMKEDLMEQYCLSEEQAMEKIAQYSL